MQISEKELIQIINEEIDRMIEDQEIEENVLDRLKATAAGNINPFASQANKTLRKAASTMNSYANHLQKLQQKLDADSAKLGISDVEDIKAVSNTIKQTQQQVANVAKTAPRSEKFKNAVERALADRAGGQTSSYNPGQTPAASPTASPTASPAATPAASPASSPASTPAASPASTPAAEPAASPAATPAAEPAASPAATPAAEPAAAEPAATPAAEPAAAEPAAAEPAAAEPAAAQSSTDRTYIAPDDAGLKAWVQGGKGDLPPRTSHRTITRRSRMGQKDGKTVFNSNEALALAKQFAQQFPDRTPSPLKQAIQDTEEVGYPDSISESSQTELSEEAYQQFIGQINEWERQFESKGKTLNEQLQEISRRWGFGK